MALVGCHNKPVSRIPRGENTRRASTSPNDAPSLGLLAPLAAGETPAGMKEGWPEKAIVHEQFADDLALHARCRSSALPAKAVGGHRSIHSTNDPSLSVTIMTRRTRSLWYINFAPPRAASIDG
jgi:hypothetical protein